MKTILTLLFLSDFSLLVSSVTSQKKKMVEICVSEDFMSNAFNVYNMEALKHFFTINI